MCQLRMFHRDTECEDSAGHTRLHTAKVARLRQCSSITARTEHSKVSAAKETKKQLRN